MEKKVLKKRVNQPFRQNMLGSQLTANIRSKGWGRTVRGGCSVLRGSGNHLKCNQINLDFEKPKQDKRHQPMLVMKKHFLLHHRYSRLSSNQSPLDTYMWLTTTLNFALFNYIIKYKCYNFLTYAEVCIFSMDTEISSFVLKILWKSVSIN